VRQTAGATGLTSAGVAAAAKGGCGQRNTDSSDKVTITIGKPEAQILFELLADFHSDSVLKFRDNAERLALVRLHGALQNTLVEPFSNDYSQFINDARNHLLKQWGTVQE